MTPSTEIQTLINKKPIPLDILIAMESSGTVRDEFLRLGHNATSCDLLPSEKDGPHYQGDVYDVLFSKKWDIIIAHPTCTKLCVSGNHVYAKGKSRHDERIEAVKWTYKFWNDCKKAGLKVCFENPKGVLTTWTDMPKPQYIQPNQFGHDASKETGLWLHGLPPLIATEFIKPRMVCRECKRTSSYDSAFMKGCIHCGAESGLLMPRWSNQTDSGQNKLGPSADRWKIRSRTYKGIALAMAEQWGR